ncbi:hypothetical protein PFISCL1PPCAC_10777, partial [Pristionchus fissidentatus]
ISHFFILRGIPIRNRYSIQSIQKMRRTPLVLVGLAQLVLDNDEGGPESNGQERDRLKGESPLVVDVEGKTSRCPSVVDVRGRSLGSPGGGLGGRVGTGANGHGQTRSVAGQHLHSLK